MGRKRAGLAPQHRAAHSGRARRFAGMALSMLRPVCTPRCICRRRWPLRPLLVGGALCLGAGLSLPEGGVGQRPCRRAGRSPRADPKQRRASCHSLYGAKAALKSLGCLWGEGSQILRGDPAPKTLQKVTARAPSFLMPILPGPIFRADPKYGPAHWHWRAADQALTPHPAI